MCGDASLTIVEDATPEAWDRYVESQRGASVYHQWRWRGIFSEAFGHETRYLAAERGGRIVGVLPLVLFRSRLFGRFIVR
jgi:hypothetical protein